MLAAMSAAEPPRGANSASPGGSAAAQPQAWGDDMSERRAAAMPQVRLADGTQVPALGMGTWHMGETARRRRQEIAALQAGLDAGMTLVDTAEMYGDGGAEEVVARAMAGRRDEVFVVSKVYPHNAGAQSAIAACERSLQRLRTDHLDLYLLHWRGRIPLSETVDAFERLHRDGKILRWGVSNFDTADIEELLSLPDGARCAVNQVLYHLAERGIEWSLAAMCRRHAIAVMAYSPVGEGALLREPNLLRIARSINATAAQVALAWLLQRDSVIAIPQTSNIAHIDENRSAAAMRLSRATLSELDAAFPPPRRATRLAVI